MGIFEVVRSTSVNAPRPRVHALVNDFHEWTAWSPWEDVDPAMQREYSGAQSGVGAGYSWRGNRKAGARLLRPARPPRPRPEQHTDGSGMTTSRLLQLRPGAGRAGS